MSPFHNPMHIKSTMKARQIVPKRPRSLPPGPPPQPPRKMRRGESSSGFQKNPGFICKICFEPKIGRDVVSIPGCTHAYCSGCIVKYVGSKLEENISNITCPVPKCKGVLELDQCRPILPRKLFDKWGDALCEATFVGSQKFYCPFKDCSAMLIDERGGEVIREAECPDCRRLFCAQCKVPWHPEIECEEFQKLHKDEREMEDIMLKNLAKNKRWNRCPRCRFYIEKVSGCEHVTCRCGTPFNYR